MITIYGASDDLVEVEGCEGADEFNVDPRDADSLAWRGDLVAPDGTAMRVIAYYWDAWSIGVGAVGDGSPPPWPVTIRPGKGMTAEARAGRARWEPEYSPVLEVDAPEGTRLTSIRPGPDDA